MYADIEAILADLSGHVACIVTTLQENNPRAIGPRNPETVFPAASLAKVPILVELARQLEQPGSAWHWDTRLEVPEAARVPSDGVLANLSPELRPTIHDLAHLMITISDN